jgi:hypothetical protein
VRVRWPVPRQFQELPCPLVLRQATPSWRSSVPRCAEQIIPVNYRLGAGHRLFFKTAPGGALAQLAEGDAQVAFEVDYHAADFRIAWSVLMNGMISRLDAAATAAYADLRLAAVPWPGPASSVLVQFMPRTVLGGAPSAPAPTKGGRPPRRRALLIALLMIIGQAGQRRGT